MMRAVALRASWLLLLATRGETRAAEMGQGSPSACQKMSPNYVGSVAVSAWDARHRAVGVNVWIDPAMASILDMDGNSLRSRIATRLSRWSLPNVPRIRAVVAKLADSDIQFTYGLTPPRS